MKYNRTYHLSFSPGTTSDDRIQKDQSKLIGSDIIITEKLDGSNSCLVKEGVYGRSHATFTNNPWDEKLRDLHNILKWDLPEGLQFFGENMEAIHSIEYNNLDSFFYLFGIRNIENNQWLSWNDVEEWSFLLGLKTVPVLYKGVINSESELKDKVDDLIKSGSKLGGSEIEGIVIRNSFSFDDNDFSLRVQKWVRKNHVKTDIHWIRNWKKARLNFTGF